MSVGRVAQLNNFPSFQFVSWQLSANFMPALEAFTQLGSWLAGASAVVKIALFFAAWLVVWSPIAVPLAIGLRWRPPHPPTVGQKIPLVLSLYTFAPLLLWATTQIEPTRLAAYGITWNFEVLSSIGLGLGLGAVGIGLLFALECGLGWAIWRLDRLPQLAPILGPSLLLGLLVSAVEESVFRGFVLTQLQHDYSIWVAAAGSSLIFALLHLVWEGVKGLPLLPGLWLMGMILVLARWVDHGSLGLACGLHAGWIWAMASLDTAQLIEQHDRGWDWVTGLDGQPLAGMLGLFLLLVTAGTLWGLASV